MFVVIDHGVVVVPEHPLGGRHLPHLAGDDTGVSQWDVFLSRPENGGPRVSDCEPQGDSPHSSPSGRLRAKR